MLLRLLFVLFVLSEVTTSQMKYFFLCLWMFISHIFSSVTEDLYDQTLDYVDVTVIKYLLHSEREKIMSMKNSYVI